MLTENTALKRQCIIQRLADHLLHHGLGGSSLRQMAKAASTSDRMLLHYFKNKEEIMRSALAVVAEQLSTHLSSILVGKYSFQALVIELLTMVRNDEFRPYLRLWLELTASSSKGDSVFREIARDIFIQYIDWVESVLDIDDPLVRKQYAALVMTMVEGGVVMDACGSEQYITLALEAFSVENINVS